MINEKDWLQILKEYHEIAFPDFKEPVISKERYPLSLLESVDGIRLGISGYSHTKLVPYVEGEVLKFKINHNGEGFSKEQEKILKKLDKWAITKNATIVLQNLLSNVKDMDYKIEAKASKDFWDLLLEEKKK